MLKERVSARETAPLAFCLALEFFRKPKSDNVESSYWFFKLLSLLVGALTARGLVMFVGIYLMSTHLHDTFSEPELNIWTIRTT